jgi:hypothetical protein
VKEDSGFCDAIEVRGFHPRRAVAPGVCAPIVGDGEEDIWWGGFCGWEERVEEYQEGQEEASRVRERV